MKCIFIYNPNSGRGMLKDKLDYIEKELKTKYDEVVMYKTKSEEDMVKTAHDACSIYDAIIFSGGDGTFSLIANSVSSCEKRPPLGYIPSGTANDIAKNLKIPFDYHRALKVILEGETIYHDAGMINDRYFVYVVGAGMFTDVSYVTDQKVKKVLGRVAYVFDIFKEFGNPFEVDAKITIKDKDKVYNKKGPLLLIMNSRSVGGVPFNKKGHLNDGKFDVVICKRFWGKILSVIYLILIGTIKGRNHTRYYDIYRGSEISIDVSDNVQWCIDGERGPKGPITIKNLRSHLQIFVPTKHHKPKSKHLLSNKKVNKMQIKEQLRKEKLDHKYENYSG